MKLSKKQSQFLVNYCNNHKNYQKTSKLSATLLTNSIKLTNIVIVNTFLVATWMYLLIKLL